MTILAQEIIYTLSLTGIIIFIILCLIIAISFCMFIETEKSLFLLITLISIISICILGFLDKPTSPTFVNKPDKICYTVEITDENIWKEIATNYTIKEKLFEDKDIYIIEGDYDNANNY